MAECPIMIEVGGMFLIPKPFEDNGDPGGDLFRGYMLSGVYDVMRRSWYTVFEQGG
jgi:hypothetical protein